VEVGVADAAEFDVDDDVGGEGFAAGEGVGGEGVVLDWAA